VGTEGIKSTGYPKRSAGDGVLDEKYKIFFSSPRFDEALSSIGLDRNSPALPRFGNDFKELFVSLGGDAEIFKKLVNQLVKTSHFNGKKRVYNIPRLVFSKT